ncbi:hypothetical protein JOE56_002099 [Brevibacterium paucivorans]|uniref:Restriction endonuclease n=1 Tax=Brevibacterium paucivorans TaxID=170994 RepID=A0ABS2SNT4_9MICO|nr:restriction endonuclease FokI C-terminal domain-containing protein [Brevibacterium paucivorans]MBM7817405.1 hypothetical protein [Brevibacterium paucivorans]
MNKVHRRTYGWVQNPSNFENLKLVVQIFDSSTAHYKALRDDLVCRLIPFIDLRNQLHDKLLNCTETFTYKELVGTSKDKNNETPKRRSDAVADGLIQVTILPQNHKTTGKEWTDNWTSDGYLRWALSLGLVTHNRATDTCSLTETGREFAQSEKSPEEDQTLIDSLLAYPPAIRILQLLDESRKPVNKFYLGSNLGFKGERGFTSYEDATMRDWLKLSTSKEEQTKIRSDIEGTADKYARGIASWLEKLGFVVSHSTTIQTSLGVCAGFREFSITAKGRHALRRSKGSSKNRRIPKYVNWEFLAIDGNTDEEKQRKDYVRTRRAHIIEILSTTKSFKNLMTRLKSLGFHDSETVVRADIEGLQGIGISVITSGNSVTLKDTIKGLDIPPLGVTPERQRTIHDKRKEKIMERTSLPLKFYELYDIAFDPKRSRDFEILTVELFKLATNTNARVLGGSLRPDGIVYQQADGQSPGIIIDTKAYADGYSKIKSQEDEMVRYIEDNQFRDPKRNPTKWWESFPKTISPKNTTFLWVSSTFTGAFDEQLKSTYHRTNANGGAVAVDQLLIGVDKVCRGELTSEELFDSLKRNQIATF